MMFLTRLWQGLVRLKRTITIGQVAAEYVVAFVLSFLSLAIFEGAVLASEGRQTTGCHIAVWLCFALLWSAVIIFLVTTGAGVVRLVQSVTGK